MIRIIFIYLFIFFSCKGLASFVEIPIDNEVVQKNKSWISLSKDQDESIRKLIEILGSTNTGKLIIEEANSKAHAMGLTLFDVLEAGDGSLTDSTLIRRFSSDNPHQIVYDYKVKVFINKRLSVMDAVTDLAHELTHFIYKKTYNPYAKSLSLPDFITSTVEDNGGEVDAFISECKVINELRPGSIGGQCEKIREEKSDGKIVFSREKTITLFYQVGNYFEGMTEKLRKKKIDYSTLKNLSNRPSIFISSAYGMPYPVAAIYEFELINEKACKNDSRRLSMMESDLLKTTRSPASFDQVNTQIRYQKLQKSYTERCTQLN